MSHESPLRAHLAQPTRPTSYPGLATSIIFGGRGWRHPEYGHLRSAVIQEYQPGTGRSPHTHRGVTLLAYVLEGDVEVQIERSTVFLKPGDTVIIQPGEQHYLHALDLPAKVFCVYVAAPGHEEDPDPWQPALRF